MIQLEKSRQRGLSVLPSSTSGKNPTELLRVQEEEMFDQYWNMIWSVGQKPLLTPERNFSSNIKINPQYANNNYSNTIGQGQASRHSLREIKSKF
jgi:hypothetical protein